MGRITLFLFVLLSILSCKSEFYKCEKGINKNSNIVYYNLSFDFSIQLCGNLLIDQNPNHLHNREVKDIYEIIRKRNSMAKPCKKYFNFYACQNKKIADSPFITIYSESFVFSGKGTHSLFHGMADSMAYLGNMQTVIGSYKLHFDTGSFTFNRQAFSYLDIYLEKGDTVHRFFFMTDASGAHALQGDSNVSDSSVLSSINRFQFCHLYQYAIGNVISFSHPARKDDDCLLLMNYQDTDTGKQYKYFYEEKIANINHIISNNKCLNDNREVRNLLYSYQSYYYSFLNEEDSAKYYAEYDRMQSLNFARNNYDVATAKPKSLISLDSFLNGIPDSNQIILLNEAHHINIHRDVAAQFLRKLKSKGYDYFAVEGIWGNDSNIWKNKMPSYQSGFYIQSPNYANLIREAIKLDYKIISYEDIANDAHYEREKKQAENINREIFEKDKQAKVIVYCGYDHIRKNDGARTMGSYLLKLANHAMVSISQTNYYEHFNKALNNIDYKALSREKTICIVKNDDGGTMGVDYNIYIPPGSNKLDTSRKLVNLGKLLPFPGNSGEKKYFLIFFQNEFSLLGYNAIPVIEGKIDMVSGQDIRLPGGKYTIALMDDRFRQLEIDNVEVK